ncbi:MAG: hypothetical protein ACI9SC_002734 [Gammaproteobacteria bacterium]|jgi:hypothetical protein
MPMRYLMVFPVLLCIISCAKNESSFYPLEAGLVWLYEIKKHTVIGVSRQRELIHNLGQRDTGEEKTYIRTSATGTESIYLHTENGIRLKYRILPDKTIIKDNDITTTIFDYPLTVGTQWQDFFITSSLKSFDPQAKDVIESIPVTVKIQSVNDTVRVAAGKFINCIRIESAGEKLIQEGKYAYQETMTITLLNTRWYASGVGLVKEVQTEKTNILQYPEGNFTKSLKNFYRTK